MTTDGVNTARVWLLLGDKVGDNRQVERIADALDVSTELRRLQFLPRWRQGKPLFVPSLFHVDHEASDSLVPPWPDLILTTGRRPAMAALWVRRRSGGRTRIVLLGRPKRFFDDFALIVTPAQYRMPERGNVLKLGLPLIRLDETRVRAAADAWREALADLPRPLTVLLVGGRTMPWRLDAAVARDLLARTVASMPAGGGLYVSTSRRTPPAVVAALREALPAGARLHAFEDGTGAGDAPANPYLGLLGLGDRFVVTGDSVSMLTEIARLQRPLQLFPLPPDEALYPRLYRAAEESRLLRGLLEPLRRWGLVGWPRDLRALHDLLVAEGWATPLGAGEGSRHAGPEAPPEDEIARVVARVRALIDGEGT